MSPNRIPRTIATQHRRASTPPAKVIQAKARAVHRTALRVNPQAPTVVVNPQANLNRRNQAATVNRLTVTHGRVNRSPVIPVPHTPPRGNQAAAHQVRWEAVQAKVIARARATVIARAKAKANHKADLEVREANPRAATHRKAPRVAIDQVTALLGLPVTRQVHQRASQTANRIHPPAILNHHRRVNLTIHPQVNPINPANQTGQV